MNCREVKEWLMDNLTAAGLETGGEVAAHLDECADCRSFYRELAALSMKLAPLAEISLTEAESVRLEDAVDAAMQTAAISGEKGRQQRRIFPIIRIAAAVAAMILIVIVSFRNNSVDISYPIFNIDDFELTGTSVQDLAPLFIDNGRDLLPSMIDAQSAEYLTDQVNPAQAEDILESATSEEIDWLMKNYSMEI
jgi:hypothetical protein